MSRDDGRRHGALTYSSWPSCWSSSIATPKTIETRFLRYWLSDGLRLSKIRFMSTESDFFSERKVSATEASRAFSRLLDEIDGGRRFLVQRRGRDICLMTRPSAAGRRASECLALLRARSPVLLDDRFGRDILNIILEEPVVEPMSWDS